MMLAGVAMLDTDREVLGVAGRPEDDLRRLIFSRNVVRVLTVEPEQLSAD